MLHEKILNSGQDCRPLTLSAGDSHASRLVQLEKDKERKMIVTSGRKCLELSTNFAPLGCLERMLLVLYPWDSTRRCLTWKAKDTKQGHLYFQLVPSVPSTGDTAFLLWPTLTVSEWRGVAKNRYYGSSKYRSDKLASRFRKQSEDLTHINPDYAEAYMGFPMGWTVLRH